MINRLLGWLFALVTLAVVVFVILGWGDYSSMCFDEAVEEVVVVEEKENEESCDALPTVDSVSLSQPAVEVGISE